MEAARGRVAAVIRTAIAVIAVGRRPPNARPAGAGIARGASIAVIARGRVGGVDALPRRWVAAVVRADVAVVAGTTVTEVRVRDRAGDHIVWVQVDGC